MGRLLVRASGPASLFRGLWLQALGLLLVGLNACGGSGREDNEEVELLPPPEAPAVSESPSARQIERHRARFKLHPKTYGPSLANEPAPRPWLLMPAGGDQLRPPQGGTMAASCVPGFRRRLSPGRPPPRWLSRWASGPVMASASATRCQRPSIRVKHKAARDVAAQLADGYAVYPSGSAAGTDLIVRTKADGIEDFVVLEKRPERASASYEVTLNSEIAGVRLLSNTIEFLDHEGTPRLRVPPPYLVDSDNKRIDATLAVRGCAVDSSPAPPWGRKVTPPGAQSCDVDVAWSDASVRYPALLDPQWTTTGALAVGRERHSSILLGNGRVFVSGGTWSSYYAGPDTHAELYDPGTGTWSSTTQNSVGARERPAMARLPDGRILIDGGGSTEISRPLHGHVRKPQAAYGVESTPPSGRPTA